MVSPKAWLILTPNMSKAVEIINGVDSKKLNLFLSRIILEMKHNSNSLKPFNDEEKEKLQISFSIDCEQLNLLLHSSFLILSQALFHITNPDILKDALICDLKMNADKALVFSNIWSSNAKNLILKLKQKPVYSTQLEDITWLANIETASQNKIQTFESKAILQLKLKSETGTQNLHLELNERHLYKIYNVLEAIQNSIDSLS